MLDKRDKNQKRKNRVAAEESSSLTPKHASAWAVHSVGSVIENNTAESELEPIPVSDQIMN